jgi:hypothetical protein
MACRILLMLLGAAFLTAIDPAGAQQARNSAPVTFPSRLSKVRSPTGVTVYYVDPGPDSDGIDERPIMLRYPSGRTEQIDSFTRSADVSWSPAGSYLAVTNYIGSNLSDCLAVTPSNGGSHKESLTAAIKRTAPRAIVRDLRRGDHVYVACKRWRSPSVVEVEMDGYGCSPAPCTPRSFEHHLAYDFTSGRLSR